MIGFVYLDPCWFLTMRKVLNASRALGYPNGFLLIPECFLYGSFRGRAEWAGDHFAEREVAIEIREI